jgi:hypothetical protein
MDHSVFDCSNKELIRTKVLNLSLTQWEKVKRIEVNGYINITPHELINLIGFDGGMFLSAITNEREMLFIYNFYDIGRKLNN